MKNLDVMKFEEFFCEFVLSSEEMICVRGGEGDPILMPTPPTSKL